MTRRVFVALSIAVLLPALAGAQGDPKAGQAAFRGKLCYFCHGENGEGGFGPDLAGARGLTVEQFRHAIRKPWGVMLAYTEGQLTDAQIDGIYAFLKAKPPAKEIGHWHWPAAVASAPYEQRVYMQITGCGQCHEPENKMGRMWLGEYAKEVNFEYFKRVIYTHTRKYPQQAMMGNYSPDRLSEANLRAIYKFMVEDLGVRASIGAIKTGFNPGNAPAPITIAEQSGGNTTYKVTVANRGIKNVGVDAEGLTVFVRVPAGTKVISGTGPGYKGTQTLASLGLLPALALATHPNEQGATVPPPADTSGDVIVWKLPKLTAAESVDLSFTLPGAPAEELIRAMDGSAVHWEKPGRTAYGKKLQYRDTRTPDSGDHERLTPPRLPAPAARPAGN
ncbi:c-type cytochrome [Ramlibacter sp.]|uniref:c-type cytochrome n=1 Tax=Ramlibacter sp. TaxID=1917967 RepID=UPI003D1384C8